MAVITSTTNLSVLDIANAMNDNTGVPYNLSSYQRGGTYVEFIVNSASGYGHDNIRDQIVSPNPITEVKISDYLKSGFHTVDTCSFTAGVSGTYTGISSVLSFGSGASGMTSFGNSPAWDLNLGIFYESGAGYIYIGGSTSVTSAANYANTGYSTFAGITIVPNGFSPASTFTIYDTSYYGYALAAGYWTFAWSVASSPLISGETYTIGKLDCT